MSATPDDRNGSSPEVGTLGEFQKAVANNKAVDPDVYLQRIQDPGQQAELRLELSRILALHKGRSPAGIAHRWALSSDDTQSGSIEAACETRTTGQPSSMPSSIGRFEIQGLLGTGGFGIVYLARDAELDRQVAIKVPRPERLGNEQELQRFLEEAQKAARFAHSGIVRVHDVQREQDFAYIVQEFIDGVNLADYVKANPLNPVRVAQLMIGVGEAVGYAHQRGFVHRDLKPSNILIDRSGRPHVADFGLAVHESARRSRHREFAGTWPYMSPEQTRGETHRLDGRSDIWSLGVILYQLLTGRYPFDGDSREELVASINQSDPIRPCIEDATLPNELARICLVCLAKRATDRYQDTTALIGDLKHWLAQETAATRPASVETSPATIAAGLQHPGWRPFTSAHANIFPLLLPGQPDRDGIPHGVGMRRPRRV